MEKEYEWKFTVDGVPHIIHCQVMTNKYVLRVDNEYWKTVYRKSSQHSRGGIDEDMNLWGRPCHFVVWQNENVEFFFNGRSLNHPEENEQNQDTSHEKSRGRKDKMKRQCAWLMVIFMAVVFVGGLVMAFKSKDVSRWVWISVGALAILMVNLRVIHKNKPWR